MNVVVLGRGRVGRGLIAALGDASFDVRLVAARGPAAIRAAKSADVVVLAVPDGAIARVAADLAPALTRRRVVLHCAGARGSAELAPLRARGVHVGAMHPLASFADPRRPPPLAGVTFFVGGDAAAVRAAKKIARAAGARAVVAGVHGPAYHAAAALAANGAAALAWAAVRALERLGPKRREAEHAIGALLATVAHNVSYAGVPRALTGPIVRGDAETVAAHRAALRSTDAAAADAYDAIAPTIVACAEEAGLSPSRASAVDDALGRRATRSRPSKSRRK